MVPYPLWANIFTEHFHPNPNACSYVPHEISTLLNSMEGARGVFLQGTVGHGSGFLSRVSIKWKNINLGTHTTQELAHQVYKEAKGVHVRCMAEEWKVSLDERVYDYLMSWEVS